MTIKNKLIGLVLIVLLSVVALFGLLRYSLNSLEQLKNMEKLISALEADKALLTGFEHDFINKPDPETEKQFATTLSVLNKHLDEEKAFLVEAKLNTQSIDELKTLLKRYEQGFQKVAASLYRIGLNENEGLRGELRSAVKTAEKSILKVKDDTMLALILQLRRNEKDFIIRQDIKYLDKYTKNFYKATKHLTNSDQFPSGDKQNNLDLMQTYKTGFINLVKEREVLGLKGDQGLIGEMSSLSKQALEKMEVLSDELGMIVKDRIQELELYAALLVLLVGIVVCVISYYISHSIITPIHHLGQLMQDVKDSKNLSTRYSRPTSDEIGTMGHNFNEMMNAFQQLIGDVKTSSTHLVDAAMKLSDLSNQTSQGLDSQQHEVLQVVSAIHQMESAMQEIAGNTEVTASTAQSALDDSTNSRSTVSQLISDIEGLAQQAQETNEMVQRLQSNSDEIGSVLDVIKSIAEQTNLLALNASIEAARAGDHGRGFAVVADEVRGLAARTQESASEIESMISELQGSTVNVSNLMSTSVDKSEQSAAEAAHSISALDSITNGAANIVDMTTQVASATEQQAAVAAEINQNVEQIRTIITATNDQTKENADISTQVSQEAQSLQRAVGQFTV